jgi:hypothetical protein
MSLGFLKSEPCPGCARLSGAGQLRARANADGPGFGGRNSSLFVGLFLMALAVLAFVVLRGA